VSGSSAPLFDGVTQGYAASSNRLGTRWAFTPLGNTAPTIITDEHGVELGSLSFPVGAHWNLISDDGRKLVTSRTVPVPSYDVFDLSPLGNGGQAQLVGSVAIPLAPPLSSRPLTNLYLTPHEDEVVSCAWERSGAVAIP
jgi:hypothetical protein